MTDLNGEFQYFRGENGIVTADFARGAKIGHDRPESPVTMKRNGRSRCSGICTRQGYSENPHLESNKLSEIADKTIRCVKKITFHVVMPPPQKQGTVHPLLSVVPKYMYFIMCGFYDQYIARHFHVTAHTFIVNIEFKVLGDFTCRFRKFPSVVS